MDHTSFFMHFHLPGPEEAVQTSSEGLGPF